MTLAELPLLNASLNATSGVLLVVGFMLIRRGHVRRHRAVMIAACVVSALFFTSYIIYHANIGSKPFEGRGPVRFLYFSILITHVIFAATVPPLALITLSRGLRSRFDRHRAIAQWTLPIWLYVSVTGVVVYLMLYQLY
jgi:putative membrane protein